MGKLSNKELLATFQKKVFYGEDTLVFDCFGVIKKLEDHPRIYILSRNHYLLFRKPDIADASATKNKILSFIKTFQNDLENKAKAIVNVFIGVFYNLIPNTITTSGFKKDLKLSKQEVMVQLLSELFGVPKNDPIIIKLFEIYKKNDYYSDEFKDALSKEILSFASRELKIVENNLDSYFDTIKTELNKIPINEKRNNFIDEEVKRVIASSEAKKLLEIALNSDLVFYIIPVDKFAALVHRGKNGEANVSQNIIWLNFNNLYNRFPYMTLFGGIGVLPALLEKNQQFGDQCYAPFINILTEEIADLVFYKYLSPAKKQELFPEFSTAIDEVSAKQPLALAVQKQVVDLILANKKSELSNSQNTLWEQMRNVVSAMRQKIHPDPRKFVAIVSQRSQIGSTFDLKIPGVKGLFTLKEFPKIKFEGVPDSQKVALLEMAAVEEQLSDIHIADLIDSIIYLIKNEINRTKELYITEKFSEEMAGKLLKVYVLYPQYLQQFLKEVHKQYSKLIANLNPPRTQICQDGLCTSDSAISNAVFIPWKNATVTEFTHTLTNNGFFSKKQNSMSFYVAYFSEGIIQDHRTKAMIFTLHIINTTTGEIDGSMQFYGTPILCRMPDMNSDTLNIFNVKGDIAKKIVSQINPDAIEDICAIQPITFMQQVIKKSIESAESGALLGGRNLGKKLLVRSGYSPITAHFIADLSFYTTIFFVQLNRALQKYEDASLALHEASLATLQFTTLKIFLDNITLLGNSLIQHQYIKSGKFLEILGNYGILAYEGLASLISAYNNENYSEIPEATLTISANLAVGTTTAIATEFVAEKTLTGLWKFGYQFFCKLLPFPDFDAYPPETADSQNQQNFNP